MSYNRGFFLNDTHPGGYIVNAYYGKSTAATSGVAGDIVYSDWRGDRYFDTDPHVIGSSRHAEPGGCADDRDGTV